MTAKHKTYILGLNLLLVTEMETNIRKVAFRPILNLFLFPEIWILLNFKYENSVCSHVLMCFNL
jgi:hypothetical protein